MAENGRQVSRNCPECGTRRPVNASVCPHCGALVESRQLRRPVDDDVEFEDPSGAGAASAEGAGADARLSDEPVDRPAQVSSRSVGSAASASRSVGSVASSPPAGSSRSARTASGPSAPSGRPGARRDGPAPLPGTERARAESGQREDDLFSSEPDPFEPPPSRWRAFLDRLKGVSGLALLRRLAALAALVVILIALAYAMFPFKAGATDCSPALIQVFDRQRLTPPAAPGQAPGPPITTPTTSAPGTAPVATPKGVIKPCTKKAQHRVYYAVPIVILALIGSAGVQRILS